MLSYETAVKLKDAGFAQPKDYCKDCDFFKWYDDEGVVFNSMEIGNEDTWDSEKTYIPTLSELIDSVTEPGCPFVLCKDKNDIWITTNYKKTERMNTPAISYQIQDTCPEELLAKLWLENNQEVDKQK